MDLLHIEIKEAQLPCTSGANGSYYGFWVTDWIAYFKNFYTPAETTSLTTKVKKKQEQLH